MTRNERGKEELQGKFEWKSVGVGRKQGAARKVLEEPMGRRGKRVWVEVGEGVLEYEGGYQVQWGFRRQGGNVLGKVERRGNS